MASFPSIRIEGGLLGPELLDQVIAADVPGQKPADFGLEPKRNLTDEIAAAFADARAQWGIFKNRLARLPEDDLATTVTRDTFVIPFLGLLGYELTFNARAHEVDGMSFAVSHGAGAAARDTETRRRGDTEKGGSLPGSVSPLSASSDLPPVHIVGARQELGRVPASGRPRLAPHSLVQEYLNRTEHVWGIVTNGLTLRLLRDSTLVRRQAYVEFDLQAIFEEQRFHDFAALYRLLHRSRLPRGLADANECLLEKYHAQALEQGGRVREHLRDGVEECLKLLGNGFLAHPDNDALRASLSPSEGERAGERGARLTPAQFYRQLLRLVYRFLFLLVSEDRGLISPNQIYRDHYGIARLRRMLDVRAAWTDHADLWLSLRTLWKLFSDDTPQPSLGGKPLAAILDLPLLNGELFAPQTLDACTLSNRDLLSALWYLAYYQERQGAPPRRVNYAALDVEELGSVYESLLEFHPDISEDLGARRGDAETPRGDKPDSLRVSGSPLSASLRFDLVFGSERKTTGSFYTPPELVNELIESALVPVIKERLAAAKQDTETRRRGDTEKGGLRVSASPLSASAGERALLSLKIIDPACGSGHMLLAAARRIGKELARLRTGEDEPAPERVRESIRDVISHCIYGVDRNPLAVDLCRVALWLESHTAGKPLTFLDHRIRCGDSLVGVFDLGVLQQGIPDKAFDPCEGDDKTVARSATKRNKEEKRGAQDLFAVRDSHDAEALTRHSRELDAIPDDSPELIRRKKELFEASHRDPAWLRQKQACDLWTAAFFQNLVAQTSQSAVSQVSKLASAAPSQRPADWEIGDTAGSETCATQQSTPIITSAALADHLDGRPIDSRLPGSAGPLAHRLSFFHWPLEFPEVFASGEDKAASDHSPFATHHSPTDSPGFDVILSNPPWERIKLQEQEFFATRDPRIATAANKAARSKLIKDLTEKNPTLHAEFVAAVHAADATSKFLRHSGRCPLTGTGDINTYAVFAETIRRLLAPDGRAGVIVPTGIATDATCQDFFADLNQRGQLASLFDFENREGLFPAVDSRMKFVLLTLRGDEGRAGSPLPAVGAHGVTRPTNPAAFAFFLTRAEHLRDPRRRFTLSAADLALFNPNTRTCPVFRTRADADLTRAIYQRVPVLFREGAPDGNPWGIRFMTMFHMSNDSHLFRTREQLLAEGCRLEGNVFVKPDPGSASPERYLPLYEAKLMHQFDHRFATYEAERMASGEWRVETRETTPEEKAGPAFGIQPRYWVAEAEVLARLANSESPMANGGTEPSSLAARSSIPCWLLGFRDICRATDERTAIFSFLPRVGVGNNAPLMLLGVSQAALQLCLLGNLSAFVFDFCARQKVGGTHMNFFLVEQLPVFPPSFYRPADVAYVASRVLELVYTADDMQPLAEAVANCEWRIANSGRSGASDHSPLATRHSPFPWDEDRRAQLRAELDAWFARAYGLTRKQLRYLLDPADLTPRELENILDPWEEVRDPLDAAAYAARAAASDFPGETFRVLKEKELAKFGEYRTRRLVLEAWDRLAAADVSRL